ncbi:hypothetical protein SAMN05421862_103266 [Pseudomonas extremaustralis]|uniref:hypothetical protein n=1 Tax=Pseudomonas extremaustralis TaxID=359110 RepID=UPI0009C8CDEC|nr:hypothetical protein [Pseudomonas extremaustralis]SKA84520.1 hypothetical protein SAMN05421862_103266 [Pseudomonas extremaustralis]
MSLKDFWSLPPLDDEVFSSWLFRKILSDRWLGSKNLPLHKLFTGSEYEDNYFDPDYQIGGADFISCCELVGDNPQIVSSQFKCNAEWIIPRTVRRSYCIECMKESIRICGLPIYKWSWGLVMMPFCGRHGELLYQGTFDSANKMSLGLDLFKKHWDDRRHEINSTLLDKTFPWLHLARNIQATLQTRPVIQSQVLHKILMQLFFNRHFSFTSYEVSQDLWGATGGFFEGNRHSSRSALHYDGVMACTIVRAKALLYLGRVLDLITDEQMETSLGDHYFMPKSLADMVAHVGRARQLPHPDIIHRRLRCFVDKSAPEGVVNFMEAILHASKT